MAQKQKEWECAILDDKCRGVVVGVIIISPSICLAKFSLVLATPILPYNLC